MKVSRLGSRTTSTPPYAPTKAKGKKNAPNKKAAKPSGANSIKKYASKPPTISTAVNKSLQTLNPSMKSSATKKYGKAVKGLMGKGMISESYGRFGYTRP